MSLSSVIRNTGLLMRSIILPNNAQTLRLCSSEVTQSESSSLDMPIEMENPFLRDKEQCILCKMNIQPDYKNTKLLSQFVSPFTGRLYGRHITRLCKHKQELIEKEIVKAQNAGFMPYMNKEPAFLEDPKLFNPERPIRSHDYC